MKPEILEELILNVDQELYQPAAFDSARDSISGVSIQGFCSFTLSLAEPILEVELRTSRVDLVAAVLVRVQIFQFTKSGNLPWHQ